ncbi:glycosyltransferase [Candidatus Parcubacteria bacterium]|nr:glycosyltransferase [Candidatus Parcubacteria bacterium]
MKYLRKKTIKAFLKSFDQDYLGGILKKTVSRSKPTLIMKEMTQVDLDSALNNIKDQIHKPLPTDREVKRVEIIYLKYKTPEVETKCADYLIENTEWPYKINVFDNRGMGKNMSKVWNKLITESTCDYVIIMDSDCFVPKIEPCWLTRCMETFDQYPDCFVVSPMITRTSGRQQQAWKPENRQPEKMNEIFAGMCTIYKKDIFNKIGWFDEDFLLFGSDTEWAHRLMNSRECAGYLRPDVVVDHIGHYSTAKAAVDEKTEYNARVEKEYSKELFTKKTGLPS